MAEKATKLVFEKHYDDNSGVRAAVSYDSTKDNAIKIMSVSEEWEAGFPITDLDWLISSLQRVRDEL